MTDLLRVTAREIPPPPTTGNEALLTRHETTVVYALTIALACAGAIVLSTTNGRPSEYDALVSIGLLAIAPGVLALRWPSYAMLRRACTIGAVAYVIARTSTDAEFSTKADLASAIQLRNNVLIVTFLGLLAGSSLGFLMMRERSRSSPTAMTRFTFAMLLLFAIGVGYKLVEIAPIHALFPVVEPARTHGLFGDC